MSDVGTTLRGAREARGLSLGDVEKATRIRERFLEALEQGNFEALGGAVYARGFLRNYALFLGLEPGPLLAAAGLHDDNVTLRDGNNTGDDGYQPRYLSEPLRGNGFPFVRVLAPLLVLALLGAAALSLWGQPAGRDALLTRLGLEPLATATAPARLETPGVAGSPIVETRIVTQTVVIEPFSSPTPQQRVTPVPTATLPPRTPTPDLNATPTAEAATPTAAPVQGILVLAQVLAPTWTEVYVDGQETALIYRTLQPGEQYEWQASSELYLRSGNAAGLQLTLNGQPLGVLGREGGLSVRHWQSDPAGGSPQLLESFDR